MRLGGNPAGGSETNRDAGRRDGSRAAASRRGALAPTTVRAGELEAFRGAATTSGGGPYASWWISRSFVSGMNSVPMTAVPMATTVGYQRP